MKAAPLILAMVFGADDGECVTPQSLMISRGSFPYLYLPVLYPLILFGTAILLLILPLLGKVRRGLLSMGDKKRCRSTI